MGAACSWLLGKFGLGGWVVFGTVAVTVFLLLRVGHWHLQLMLRGNQEAGGLELALQQAEQLVRQEAR